MKNIPHAGAHKGKRGLAGRFKRAWCRVIEGAGVRISGIGAWMTIRGSRPYHPLGIYQEALLDRPGEAFEQRWSYVSSAMESYQAASFLDLGCAEGYYVRRAAIEHGAFAIGIDNNLQRLRRLHSVSYLEDKWRYGFMNMKIDSDSVRRLPVFDVIACMSLLHHVIYQHGIDEARLLMQAIASRTGKCMLFDMGGPDEASNDWAPSLSMFEGDVAGKISSFLKECGFARVNTVGSSIGYRDSIQRPFFVAEP